MLNSGEWVLDDEGIEWRVHGSHKGARVLLERYAGNNMVQRSWKIAKWLTKLDPALYPILDFTQSIGVNDTPIYTDARLPVFERNTKNVE